MSISVDFLVIGAGSGGLAAARKAAKFGAKVAVVDANHLGGTCVNNGCVPKKVTWNAAHILEGIKHAADYGIDVQSSCNWGILKRNRDAYIARLNEIYANNLERDNVQYVHGLAKFTSPNTVLVNETTEITATHILISTGSRAYIANIPGKEYFSTSDDFFKLQEKPNRVLLIGNGYISCELAGIFNTFGVNTTISMREDYILKPFDQELAAVLMEQMTKDGITFLPVHDVIEIRKTETGLLAIYDKGEEIEFDQIYCNIGRGGNVIGLELQAAGVKFERGMIPTDEYENTNVPNIYALGDVNGKLLLTPVAVSAGRKLAERLFGNQPYAKLDYNNVPSNLFSHPPFGMIGLTEEAARAQYGDTVKIYKSRFTNMFFSLSEKKEPTMMKLVCVGPEERVVGLHSLGRGSDELLQGFSVAVRMGATKQDFDNCVAIHPTASEEFVTMP